MEGRMSFTSILESKKIRGSEARRRVVTSQWKRAEALLAKSGLRDIDPALWPDYAEKLFDCAVSEGISLGYFVKVLDLINLYGRFVAREKYTSKIASPRGFNRQRFLDQCGTNASAALSHSQLLSKRANFTAPEFRFLRASLYLGLRPTEVDDCANWTLEDNVLVVPQTKLTQVDKNARIKAIPLIEPEQKQVIEEIVVRGYEVARPSLEKLHAAFGDRVHTYAGRKGLVAFLMERGYTEFECSSILGHADVKTTRAYYTDQAHARRQTALSMLRKRA